MSIFQKLFPCRFNNPDCKSVFGCKCGKGGESYSAPDPAAVAKAQVDAQIEEIPRAMQTYYQNLISPEYGIDPTTKAYIDVRQKYYPTETAVQNQLGANVLEQLQNPLTAEQYAQQVGDLQGPAPQGMSDLQGALTQQILSELQSPTGITPEQQAAIDARRGLAQSQAQEGLRTRQNLGGNLYGGRSITQEGRMLNELQNAFAEEDISREAAARQQAMSNAQAFLPQLLGIEQNQYNRAAGAVGQEQTAMLNALQQALPFLQLLYPEVGIQSPQFINPVPSADNIYQSQTSMAQQQMANQSKEDISNQQLLASIFESIGGSTGKIATLGF